MKEIMTTFTGFSEEDVIRIKSDSGANSELNNHQIEIQPNVKRIDKIGAKIRKPLQYKTPKLNEQLSYDILDDNLSFEKCRLSLKSPTSDSKEVKNDVPNNNIVGSNINEVIQDEQNESKVTESSEPTQENELQIVQLNENEEIPNNNNDDCRKSSIDSYKLRGNVENYSEYEVADNLIKLEELQLKQKLIQEQNKKRKEMLARALADRTKQTAEEVQRLEKIKNELHILDGQFSHDVALLRKKIDHACLSYAEAEKHYLKVEKEFLHAKIQLQKEREKKELLTEHLCALITHNETRKAQKLETLMHQLVEDKISGVFGDDSSAVEDDPVIVDGVDERTGKIVEINSTEL